MKQDSPCKEQAPVHRVAAIDLGTVSSRLALAEVREGTIVSLEKHTVITDLGEGVDATHRFCDAAVERVVAACEQFEQVRPTVIAVMNETFTDLSLYEGFAPPVIRGRRAITL